MKKAVIALILLSAVLSCSKNLMPETAKPGTDTFSNPVTDYDWPDPTVWTDGQRFYSVATGLKKVISSTNLITWEDTGIKPTRDTVAMRALGRNFWAPDVTRIGDKWIMYVTLYNSAEDCGIAVLSSDTPEGPFSFVRRITWSRETGIRDSIDPEVVKDPEDGGLWLFFGSIGGVHRVRLDPDGGNIVGKYEHVAGLTVNEDPSRGKVFEGTYLYQHDGYWYLFASAGNYGNSSYRIVVGRSPSLSGEFLDKQGHRMIDGSATTLMQSGKNGSLYGPGHNGEIYTDDKGQDYIFFHSHYSKVASGWRPMCLQRIFWDNDGWPYVTDSKPAEIEAAPVISLKTRRNGLSGSSRLPARKTGGRRR